MIDRIGRELQSRMSYSDIDVYLSAHGINCKDFQPSTNSKWVYAKELLTNAEEDLILKIADELELEHSHSSASPKEATFWKAGQFKLFLSHLAVFKVTTAKLQHALKTYAITSFVAHEDIEPSREWQTEIETALNTMDAMAAILMPGFKESNWCDQEVGVAVGRGVLVIPIRKGLDPYGFIGKYQGIQAANKTVREVAHEMFTTLINSPKTKAKMIRCISTAISQSTEVDEALKKVSLLQAIPQVSKDSLESLKADVNENNLLANSTVFIQEINALLSKYDIKEIQVGGAKEPALDDDIPF